MMIAENNKPLISIVVPYYNSRIDYFQEAMESILSQSYTDWEVVIVNDGSGLEHKDFLEKYVSNLNENRVSIIHLERNLGPSVARNRGIEKAKGEIVTFLDSDDLLFPWCYEHIVENFKKNPHCLALASTYVYYVDIFKIRRLTIPRTFSSFFHGKEKPDNILSRIKQGKEALFPFLSIRKETFNYIKFDPLLLIGEDTDLTLQILDKKELMDKVSIAPVIGYIYRLYPSKDRLSHQLDLVFRCFKQLSNKYNDESSLPHTMIKNFYKYRVEWKFSDLVCNYFDSGSIIKTLKYIFSNFYILRDRVEAIRALIIMVFIHNFLMPKFGIDFKCLNTLMDWKNDKYKILKKTFQHYLSKYKNGKTTLYAKKVFERMFY